MSLCVRKPTIWVPTRSDTNRTVQLQKMVRGWKFWILKVEELYYPCSKIKVLISFKVTAMLICTFVFAYADCCFSHAVAHIQIFTSLKFSGPCVRNAFVKYSKHVPAEITQLENPSVGVEQKILWFDISMTYSLGVNIR